MSASQGEAPNCERSARKLFDVEACPLANEIDGVTPDDLCELATDITAGDPRERPRCGNKEHLPAASLKNAVDTLPSSTVGLSSFASQAADPEAVFVYKPRNAREAPTWQGAAEEDSGDAAANTVDSSREHVISPPKHAIGSLSLFSEEVQWSDDAAVKKAADSRARPREPPTPEPQDDILFDTSSGTCRPPLESGGGPQSPTLWRPQVQAKAAFDAMAAKEFVGVEANASNASCRTGSQRSLDAQSQHDAREDKLSFDGGIGDAALVALLASEGDIGCGSTTSGSGENGAVTEESPASDDGQVEGMDRLPTVIARNQQLIDQLSEWRDGPVYLRTSSEPVLCGFGEHEDP